MISSCSVLIWFSGLLTASHSVAVLFFWWAVVYVFLVVCSNIIFRVVYASPPWSCAFFFGERSFMISSCSVLIWFSGLLTVPPGCAVFFLVSRRLPAVFAYVIYSAAAERSATVNSRFPDSWTVFLITVSRFGEPFFIFSSWSVLKWFSGFCEPSFTCGWHNLLSRSRPKRNSELALPWLDCQWCVFNYRLNLWHLSE